MPHLDAYDGDGIDDAEPEDQDADEEYAARVRAEAELDERDAGGGPRRKKKMPDAFAGAHEHAGRHCAHHLGFDGQQSDKHQAM